MIRYVLDTDILTLYWQGHSAVRARVLVNPPEELAISVITIEEQIMGWYTRLRQAKNPADVEWNYHQFGEAVAFLGSWPNRLNFTQVAMIRYEQLVRLRLNVGKMDLKIAAIALENGCTVVTRNVRDFQRIPNLPIENWAV